LLGRRTGDDADHVLGADLRRIVVAIVDRQRRQVAGVAAVMVTVVGEALVTLPLATSSGLAALPSSGRRESCPPKR